MIRHCVLALLLCALTPGVLASGTKSAAARGMDYYLAGNYEIAEQEFRKALERHPLSADAHEYLGRTLIKLELWAEAVERLIRAYELMPEHQRNRFWLSIWDDIVAAMDGLLDTGKWDQAIAALADLWRLNEVSPESQDRLAQLFTEHAVRLLAEGRFEEALTAFSQGNGIRSGELQAL